MTDEAHGEIEREEKNAERHDEVGREYGLVKTRKPRYRASRRTWAVALEDVMARDLGRDGGDDRHEHESGGYGRRRRNQCAQDSECRPRIRNLHQAEEQADPNVESNGPRGESEGEDDRPDRATEGEREDVQRDPRDRPCEVVHEGERHGVVLEATQRNDEQQMLVECATDEYGLRRCVHSLHGNRLCRWDKWALIQPIVAMTILMRQRLADMAVFAQVVESKTFSAAAQKLGLSKSLVSRQVSALERSLSVKLLNRTTRRLSLTDAGALYLEHCRRVVQEAEYAERRLTQSQSELAGVVRVTCVQAFALRHLMLPLGDFQTKHPEILIKLSCSNRIVDLGETGFDVGIRMSLAPDPNLVARKLAVNRKVLCATPAYLTRNGVPRSLDDVATHDAVVFPPLAPKGRWTFRRDGQPHAVRVKPRFETDDMDAAHAAVLSGLGLGVLPLYVAAADLRLGRLVRLFPELPVLPDIGIYLVWLPNRTRPLRVRTLIDFLEKQFKPQPAWELA